MSERHVTSTQKITAEERAQLVTVMNHPGYRVLVDVLERACHKQDTLLISADVARPAEVLAQHRKSQAMWQIFEAMQEDLRAEAAIQAEQGTPEPFEMSEEDREVMNLLDPSTVRRNPHAV